MADSDLPLRPSSTTLAFDAGSHCRPGTSSAPPSCYLRARFLVFFARASINQLPPGCKWLHPENSRSRQRRDDLVVARFAAEQARCPSESVQLAHALPGYQRVVILRVAAHELLRGEVPLRRARRERRIRLERGLRRGNRARRRGGGALLRRDERRESV